MPRVTVRSPTSPQVIAAIERVKARGAHQYASDQYGIDTTIEDDVLARIVIATLDAPSRAKRGVDTGRCRVCGGPCPLTDDFCEEHL